MVICCCCSVAKSCPTLCNPMDCNTPDLPVPHHLLEFAQVHVHWIGDAIQPSHPLMHSSSSFNLSQHQDLFQGVGSLHQMAKVLKLQLQHQSFQWLEFRRVLFPIYFLLKLANIEAAGLKLNIQKTKIMASGPITSWQIDRETMETVTDYFLRFQNLCRLRLQPWN